MLSRAGLGRLSPGALAVIVLAANVPDIDVVSALGGSAAYLEHHRGPTHSLLFAPVVAILPVLAVWPFHRGRLRWVWAWMASLMGVLSHLAMDWTNVYGTRLLTPYTERWYRLDITSVIDVWIWIVLAGCTLWPILARMVAGEIGARSRSGPGAAWFGLAVILCYEGGRFLLHQRAVETLEARLHEGRVPRRVAAFPTLANPLRWRGLAELDNAYVMYDLNLARPFDPDAGQVFYKADFSPQLEAARETEAFRAFFLFSQFPIWRVIPVAEPEGGMEVQANDLRFGLPGEGRFSARCILDSRNRLVDASFQFRPPGQAPQPR
jgi:inner membrane protein